MKVSRLASDLSWLNWLHKEEWTEANFCRLRMRLKRCIARPRRRKRRCEFSTRLLNHLPVCCFSVAPSSLRAARHDAKRSVTISSEQPWLFHQFLEEFQYRLLVSAFGHNGLQHLAFMANSPRKIMPLAIHLQENLIRVPLPFRECAQFLHPLPSDLSSKLRVKPVPPISDSFELTSMPRSCSRSSTFRSESGKRMYSITARRMISGLF